MLAVNDTRATGFMAECGLNHIERVNDYHRAKGENLVKAPGDKSTEGGKTVAIPLAWAVEGWRLNIIHGVTDHQLKTMTDHIGGGGIMRRFQRANQPQNNVFISDISV